MAFKINSRTNDAKESIKQQMDLMAHGYGHKAIAEKLQISTRTVEMRLVPLRKWNGCRTTHQLIAFAVASGLVDYDHKKTAP